jgi:hypothetical protein
LNGDRVELVGGLRSGGPDLYPITRKVEMMRDQLRQFGRTEIRRTGASGGTWAGFELEVPDIEVPREIS